MKSRSHLIHAIIPKEKKSNSTMPSMPFGHSSNIDSPINPNLNCSNTLYLFFRRLTIKYHEHLFDPVHPTGFHFASTGGGSSPPPVFCEPLFTQDGVFSGGQNDIIRG